VQEDVLNLLAARKGHFLLESGHHGDVWLDLEVLCLRPRLLQPIATELARRLSRLDVEVVCGPLVEGAFVGLMVASELDVNFSYSERFAKRAEEGLFPAGYRIPRVLQSSVRQRRVAIVNDVINAGSAVRGTFAALQECGATIVAIGALLVLGASAFEFALSKNVALESIASLPNSLWTPSACPLCSAGTPLEDVGGFRVSLQNEALPHGPPS
jgi:orotate phosphoribosyltransferase